MRRAGRRLTGLLLALLGGSWMILPTLLLAGWGGVYLLSLAQTLLAPGVPLEFCYDAPAGRMLVRVESYTIDPQERKARVSRIRLEDAEGRVVASLRRAHVAFGGLVSVEGFGLRARLERLPSGGFSVEAWFPESKERRERTPFRARVVDAEIEYVDRLRSPSLPLTVRLPQTLVDSDGEAFVASARPLLGAPRAAVPLSVSWIPGTGVRVVADLLGDDLAYLAPQARRWVDPALMRDIEPVSVTTLRPVGRVVATDRPGRGLRFAADVRVVAEGVRARDLAEGARVSGRLAVRGDGLRLRGLVEEAGRSFRFDGVVLAGSSPAAAGRVEAEASSLRRVWPALRRTFPADLAATGARWAGWVALREGETMARGSVRTDRVAWGKEQGRDAQAILDVSNTGLVLHVDRVVARGDVVSGGLALVRGRLSGYASGRGLSLARLLPGLRAAGNADAIALVSGPSGSPNVEFWAVGAARARIDGREIALGDAEVRGGFAGRLVRVDRFAASAGRGAASASGTVALDGIMRLDVVGGGYSLADFDPKSNGFLFMNGQVTGRPSNPTFRGAIEAYGVQLPGVDLEVPVVASRVRIDRRQVAANRLEVAVGATVVRGLAAYDWRDGTLDGRLSAERVELADWTDGAASGLASFDDLRLSGTAANPLLSGAIQALKVSAGGFEVENVVADMRVDRREITIESARANSAGGGGVDFGGRYAFSDRRLAVHGEFSAWPIAGAPIVRDRFVGVDGTVSGPFAVEIDDDGLRGATAKLAVAGVAIGEDRIGDGSIRVGVVDSRIEGEANLGQAVRIDDFKYDPRTGTVAARIQLDRVSGGTAFAAFSAAGWKPPERLIRALDGKVSGVANVTGLIEDPAVVVESAALSSLTLEGKPAGDVRASATRSSGVWNIGQFVWTQGETRFSVSGKVDEAGPLALDADLGNFELDLLAPFWPRLAGLQGRADATVRATGTFENPEVLASASARVGPTPTPGQAAAPSRLDLLLDQIALHDRRWRVAGRFSYAGFTGSVGGQGSTSAFGTSPAPDDVVRVEAHLDDREVASFAEHAPWLDPSRSAGKVGGSILLSGNRDGYRVDGRIRTENAALAATGLDTSLKKLDVELHTDGDVVVLRAGGESTMGGTLAAVVRAQAPSLFERGSTMESTLAATDVTGSVEFKELAATQSGFFKDGRAAGQVGGRLDLGGTLLEPEVSGKLDLQALDLTLPSEFGPAGARRSTLVRPRFDIEIRADRVFRVRSGSSSFDVTGGGRVGGTLEDPVASGRLVLSRGTYRLPSARLELEPGGTMAFGYRAMAGAPADAFLDVNLMGQTSVSAARFDSIERYDVLVEVRGDLLSPNGITLGARSEPPGLTQHQILALLGQKQVFEGISQASVFRTGGLFSQVLLPTLLTPFTDRFASQMGLDYFGVEYNAFDQTTVYAAKSLARGFVIQASQQVNQTRNARRRYDLRLTYRIPSRNPLASRARIGFGFDQDRPWKLTLDYTIRF